MFSETASLDAPVDFIKLPNTQLTKLPTVNLSTIENIKKRR